MAAVRIHYVYNIAGGANQTATFTLPVDYDASGSLTVTCIGAGGGGGRSTTSSGGYGGGGGGAMARGSFSGLQPGRIIYLQLGAGGAGGSANGTDGTAGGDTWVNINSNAAPSSTSNGVLAKGGGANSLRTGGTGGAAASCIGSITTQSGGNGGAGGNGNGSGGGGGGSSAYWNGSTGYFGGNAGGAGGTVAGGDRGGGGGGGVNGGGQTTTTITGANGGLNINNGAAGAGTTSATLGGGGGGGTGTNTNNAFSGSGGNGATWVDGSGYNTTTATWTNGPVGGGGGGGGGTNNSGTTGGTGGVGGAPGGGGGGGGSGVTNAGGGGNGGNGMVIIEYTSKETMLPTTSLGFNDIQTYFGGSNPISLNEYYGGTGTVSSLSQNSSGTVIPASGQIGLSNFRGAPFKLYREVRIGSRVVSSSKFSTVLGYGLNTISASMGALDSTAFTLSGGSSVSITILEYQTDGVFTFRLDGATAPSNSGWDSLILPNLTLTRTGATFSNPTGTSSQWQWTSVTLTNTGAVHAFRITPDNLYSASTGDSIVYFV